MVSSAAATFVSIGVGVFLFFIVISFLIVLLTQNKQKVIIRPVPVDSIDSDASCSTRCDTRCDVPPRPDFSNLPSGSVTIQSVGFTPGPVTLFRGGFVDFIGASSSGNDILLRVPPLERNVRETTIRVFNSGNAGDIIFTPLPGVELCEDSNPRVLPMTTGYFIATDTNSYVRN